MIIFQWFSPSNFGHDYYWLSINLSLRKWMVFHWFSDEIFTYFWLISCEIFNAFSLIDFQCFLLINFPMLFIDWFFNDFFNKIKKANFFYSIFLSLFCCRFSNPHSPYILLIYLLLIYLLPIITPIRINVGPEGIFRIKAWTIVPLISSHTL